MIDRLIDRCAQIMAERERPSILPLSPFTFRHVLAAHSFFGIFWRLATGNRVESMRRGFSPIAEYG